MAESSTPAPKAKLTFIRKSSADNKQRQMIVTANGKSFATLMFGKEATRELAPGSYKIKVDNTWWSKTIQVDLAPGEHRAFRIINTNGKLTWPLIVLFGAGPMYVQIEPTDPPPPATS